MNNNQANKIRSINSNSGWESIDGPPTPFPPEPSEIDKIYTRVFSSEDGQKVLDHLKAITIDQPAWTPGAEPSYGYAREGQNTIVREIVQRIKRCINE